MQVDEIEEICVVGAGTMGHQIALQCAVHRFHVHLVDISKAALDEAREKIGEVQDSRVRGGEISPDLMRESLQRITYSTGLEEAARDADFVIEAVYEDVEVKRRVFIQLAAVCPPRTIFASNTSSIRPSLLADATGRPEKVLAVNFSNPVWERPCVEVMGSIDTSEETIKISMRLVQSLGLTPILVNREITGYAFNRIWRAVKREALHLVDGGYASFEDIDRAFMINLAAPAGPFMIMDVIGLDVVLAIEEQYHRESGDERDRPPDILVEKVRRGDLGVKTGRGFYQYPEPTFKRPGWLRGTQM